ncbi:hypothetical protein JCM10450v2_006141 [Rhodotorula kratochvilovae]
MSLDSSSAATTAPASSNGPAPRFPSTLAPPAYYDGLVERFSHAVLPPLAPYFFALPRGSRALELASGTGIHACLYARTFPQIEWQPTECDEYGCRKIDETVREEGTEGVRDAVEVDVMQPQGWQALRERLDERGVEGENAYDMVLAGNVIHMLPFPDGPKQIFTSLLAHRLVSPRAKLLLYGPFKHDDGFFSASDEAFNAEISSRPSPYPLGLRSIDALGRLAAESGWTLRDRIGVARGNWILVFEQEAQPEV